MKKVVDNKPRFFLYPLKTVNPGTTLCLKYGRRFFRCLFFYKLQHKKETIMIYGYCRVSTTHQHEENQHFVIEKFARKNNLTVDMWIEEKISSGKRLKDRKLGALLNELKSGDILITTEISRLGRSLLEVMGILQMCLERDCQVWTLKENFRLGTDIQSKVLAFAFGL